MPVAGTSYASLNLVSIDDRLFQGPTRLLERFVGVTLTYDKLALC